MSNIAHRMTLFRLVTDPDHKTRAAPKLNVMAVNQAFGLGYGLVVVATNERLKSYEMSVGTDGVSPIFHHEPFYERLKRACLYGI